MDVGQCREIRMSDFCTLLDVSLQVEFAEAFLVEAGCDERSAQKIAIVMEELLVNVISYSWGEGQIGLCVAELSVLRLEAALSVRLQITDDGRPYDPTSRQGAEFPENVEDAKIGGFGVYFMQKMTDSQTYERRDNQNVICISKSCPLPIERVEPDHCP